MAIKRLKFKKDLCIGCQLCMQACSAMHEDEINLSKSRIKIETYYKDKQIFIDKHICILCGKCAKECPVDAITMDTQIRVDNDACIGCGLCADVCPAHVVEMRDEKPIICDTCDGKPSCVETCPHKALTFA